MVTYTAQSKKNQIVQRNWWHMSASVNSDKSWQFLTMAEWTNQEEREERAREGERDWVRKNWNGMAAIFYGLIPSVHDKLLNQESDW